MDINQPLKKRTPISQNGTFSSADVVRHPKLIEGFLFHGWKTAGRVMELHLRATEMLGRWAD